MTRYILSRLQNGKDVTILKTDRWFYGKKCAPSVDREVMAGGYTAERSTIIRRWVGTGKNILDLGCYDGREDEALLRAGNSVTGIENLPAAASAAADRGIEVLIADLNSESWPIKGKVFDVVLAGEIIEHVIDSDRFLGQIQSCLNTGGMLVLTTPNVASLGRRIMLALGRNPFLEYSNNPRVQPYPSVGHVRYYTARDLIAQCEANGFECKELVSDYVNIGPIRSAQLGKKVPTLGWRFVGLFEKRT